MQIKFQSQQSEVCMKLWVIKLVQRRQSKRKIQVVADV